MSHEVTLTASPLQCPGYFQMWMKWRNGCLSFSMSPPSEALEPIRSRDFQSDQFSLSLKISGASVGSGGTVFFRSGYPGGFAVGTCCGRPVPCARNRVPPPGDTVPPQNHLTMFRFEQRPTRGPGSGSRRHCSFVAYIVSPPAGTNTPSHATHHGNERGKSPLAPSLRHSSRGMSGIFRYLAIAFAATI
jgi:hypothetical protein